MIPIEITKEAGVLRKRLQRGFINLPEMEQFLAKVETAAPPVGKAKGKDRFTQQLQNLDKGHSGKPGKNVSHYNG